MKYEEIRAGIPQDTSTRWLTLVVRFGKFLLVLLIVPSIMIIFRPKKSEQDAMKARVAMLTKQRDVLRDARDQRLRRVDWIKSDTDYLEMAARDRLDLQKEGEYIIRFEDEPATVKN